MEPLLFIKNYVGKNKIFQNLFLSYINDEDKDESKIHNLRIFFKKEKLLENKQVMQQILHFISSITNNHHRTNNFFIKIEAFFEIFINDIKKYFTNLEIFNIFKKNKRMLLFLMDKQIIIPDKSIYYIINNFKYQRRKYPQYFFNEFKNFFDNALNQEIYYKNLEIVKMAENNKAEFDRKRMIGENENEICLLIRKDSINEFIEFINKREISVKRRIIPSIFETNLLLLKNGASLIEYSAFYGSIRIFKYLYKYGAMLTHSLWKYAIHGKNSEIIHILEEDPSLKYDEVYDDCYMEAIKCNHTNLTNYFKNFISSKSEINIINYISQSLHFCNFIELYNLLNELKDENAIFNLDDNGRHNILYEFCKYNYYTLFVFLFDSLNANINDKIIITTYIFVNEIII